MIKLFFSHVCNDVSHPFLDWISERVKRDLRQFDPFIACKSRDWNDAKDLNDHLDESQFFNPVITDEYPDRKNCTAELDRVRSRKKLSGTFPVILPIRFGCNRDTLEHLGFQIDQESSQGERWIDFSESKDWEVRYEEFREQVTNTALEHNLLADEDFYKDCQHLDLILKRDKPTASEIKWVIDLCRKGEEYGNYFFRKLDQKEWIYYLKPFGFFKLNPSPIESPKQAGLYTIPHWPVLDYLEKVSKECSKPENRIYAEELMQIIKDVTRPRDGKKADNYRTWRCFTKIMANLPTDVIKLEDIELVGEWLDSHFDTTLVGGELGELLLPKLLQSPHESDWKKAAKLIEIATHIRWIERKYGEGDVEREPHTRINSYWLRELFRRNSNLLGEKCGEEVVEILKTRLGEVLKPDKDDVYSYIWRPAIEDHAQIHGEDRTKNILISALRDVLLAYAKKSGEQAKETLRSLLNERLFVLKRIALYVVNELYDAHGELFWDVLSPDLFDINLRHELFELLKRRFREFAEERQNQVLDMIATLTEDWREELDKTLLDAKLRLDWLQAIKGQGNERADQLYEEYLRIAKYPSEHPEFASYIETGSWEIGPCSVEELLSKSVPEIVQYLNAFKESGRWKKPTEEGLAEVLKDAVKQKPEKFEGELSPFLSTKLRYQYSILRAFEELWNDKRMIKWEKVLEFCLSLVGPDEFWRERDEPKKPGLNPTRGWITSVISSLIGAGVKSDEWAFEETHLPMAEKIILRILAKEVSTAKGREEDALSEAMNTSKGHCLQALFNYSLRQARLSDKRKEDRARFWEHIQPMFDRELDQCKGANFEFSALAGASLPNLWYLSKAWVEANINRIFSVEHETNWRCAMPGYSYVSTVYDEIYNLLREHGHLKKGLETNFKNSHVREKLIQNIAVGYLRGLEGLTDEESLFAKILRDWQPNDISEIISFFWMHHDVELEDKARSLILNFWKWCYEKTQGSEEDNTLILSDLNLLTVFLTEISDEQKAWLLQSAPYVDENHHSSFFLEYLDKLTNQNPEVVAEVYLKMLTGTVPTYKQEDIRSIVKKLYQVGFREKANDICNEYARKGYSDLRDLYDRYNS